MKTDSLSTQELSRQQCHEWLSQLPEPEKQKYIKLFSVMREIPQTPDRWYNIPDLCSRGGVVHIELRSNTRNASRSEAFWETSVGYLPAILRIAI